MKTYNLIFGLFFISICSFSQNISLAGNWSNTASWDAGNIGDFVTENVTMNDDTGSIVI